MSTHLKHHPNWMERCILGLGYRPDTLPACPCTLRTGGEDRMVAMRASVSCESRSRWHHAHHSSTVNIGMHPCLRETAHACFSSRAQGYQRSALKAICLTHFVTEVPDIMAEGML